jgi:hypothetical protein
MAADLLRATYGNPLTKAAAHGRLMDMIPMSVGDDEPGERGK